MTTRFVLTLICIAAPFLLYALYQRIRRRRAETGGDPWPVTVLWLTGAVLAIEVMLISIARDDGLKEPPASQLPWRGPAEP